MRRRPQGSCVGRLRLFAAVREGLYVPVTKRLLFQHRGVPAPLDGGTLLPSYAYYEQAEASSAGEDVDGGGSGGGGLTDGHWGPDVYSRVFLTREHVMLWQSWNQGRGDPAQPYHYQHLIEATQRQVRRASG